MSKEQKQFQRDLRMMRVWDSTRYSLTEACKQVEKHTGTSAEKLESEIDRLFKQGYYEPTIGYDAKPLDGDGRPPLGKKLLTCGCLHPPGSSGVCLFGACINITKDKWIITINI